MGEGERISGGIPLAALHVSVLPELDVNCNTMLPALDHADPPHHRTPGPSNSVEDEEEERRGENEPVVIDGARQFDVAFSFDVSDRLFLRDTVGVRRAAGFVNESGAGTVRLIGYRAGAVLSSGETIPERPDVAERRVAMVKRMLMHAGVSAESIETETVDVIDRLDGIDDHKLRIARIIVSL